MAKSLRSKWRRKMRAEKRVINDKKETLRLINMLKEAGDYQMVPESESSSEQAEDKIPITSIPRPKSASSQARRERSSTRKSRLDEFADDVKPEPEEVEMDEGEEAMSVDKEVRVYNKRTLKDQFGNYPVWLSKRKMMSKQKLNKRIKKNRAMSVSGGKKSRGGVRRK